jgi:hypothetical protein
MGRVKGEESIRATFGFSAVAGEYTLLSTRVKIGTSLAFTAISEAWIA